MFTHDYIPAKDRPEYADKLPDDGRIHPEHIAICCILAASLIVGLGALGHAAGVW